MLSSKKLQHCGRYPCTARCGIARVTALNPRRILLRTVFAQQVEDFLQALFAILNVLVNASLQFGGWRPRTEHLKFLIG